MPLDMKNFKLSRSAAEAAVREYENSVRAVFADSLYPGAPIDETLPVLTADGREAAIRYLMGEGEPSLPGVVR